MTPPPAPPSYFDGFEIRSRGDDPRDTTGSTEAVRRERGGAEAPPFTFLHSPRPSPIVSILVEPFPRQLFSRSTPRRILAPFRRRTESRKSTPPSGRVSKKHLQLLMQLKRRKVPTVLHFLLVDRFF
jgi:hypothetical protein